jgi:hypothetical protein
MSCPDLIRASRVAGTPTECMFNQLDPNHIVMPGLDPGIQGCRTGKIAANPLDCRVKPGNDKF